jgi:glycolate oxidase iron-sulfur subunit
MQTQLSPEFASGAEGKAAADIIKKCVHCGFCNATCPTYQLLGDELDGPRGRIYLIKQVLEGAEVTRSTQQHLDRCLTCLNCETTCPSGVRYGHLVDIGRSIVEARVERPPVEKAARWLLKTGLTSPLFAPALRVGRALRPLLPGLLKDKVPAKSGATGGSEPTRRHARKVLMLSGCVQPAMMPNVDTAAARVLDRAGIEVVYAGGTGCCGSLRTHLDDQAGGLDDMRRNIDAWYAVIGDGDGDGDGNGSDSGSGSGSGSGDANADGNVDGAGNAGFEAIVSSASACALAIKEYGYALAGDAAYAKKAARISAMARDLSEVVAPLLPALRSRLRQDHAKRVAFHAPCTLQHGQRLRGTVEVQLREMGFFVSSPAESHLCCGSAGTYSVLQPQLARQLRDRKLTDLEQLKPQYILSANVGCIQHLQSGTGIPVLHWIELLDEVLD